MPYIDPFRKLKPGQSRTANEDNAFTRVVQDASEPRPSESPGMGDQGAVNTFRAIITGRQDPSEAVSPLLVGLGFGEGSSPSSVVLFGFGGDDVETVTTAVPVYSWRAVDPSLDGSYQPRSPIQLEGRFDYFPAIESSNNPDVPIGTIVTLTRSEGGPYFLFDYGSIDITAKLTGCGGGTSQQQYSLEQRRQISDGTWETFTDAIVGSTSINFATTAAGPATAPVGKIAMLRRGHTSGLPRVSVETYQVGDGDTLAPIQAIRVVNFNVDFPGTYMLAAIAADGVWTFTAPIGADDDASVVNAALNDLPGISEAGGVVVSGTGADDDPFLVEWNSTAALTPEQTIWADDSLLNSDQKWVVISPVQHQAYVQVETTVTVASRYPGNWYTPDPLTVGGFTLEDECWIEPANHARLAINLKYDGQQKGWANGRAVFIANEACCDQTDPPIPIEECVGEMANEGSGPSFGDEVEGEMANDGGDSGGFIPVPSVDFPYISALGGIVEASAATEVIVSVPAHDVGDQLIIVAFNEIAGGIAAPSGWADAMTYNDADGSIDTPTYVARMFARIATGSSTFEGNVTLNMSSTATAAFAFAYKNYLPSPTPGDPAGAYEFASNGKLGCPAITLGQAQTNNCGAVATVINSNQLQIAIYSNMAPTTMTVPSGMVGLMNHTGSVFSVLMATIECPFPGVFANRQATGAAPTTWVAIGLAPEVAP